MMSIKNASLLTSYLSLRRFKAIFLSQFLFIEFVLVSFVCCSVIVLDILTLFGVDIF